jgi:hypothetical protein
MIFVQEKAQFECVAGGYGREQQRGIVQKASK